MIEVEELLRVATSFCLVSIHDRSVVREAHTHTMARDELLASWHVHFVYQSNPILFCDNKVRVPGMAFCVCNLRQKANL